MLTAIQRASSPVRTLACRGRVSPTDGAAARTQRLMWRLMLAKRAANKRSQNGGTHMTQDQQRPAPEGSAHTSLQSPGLSPVLERNIQALLRREAREAAGANWQDHIADKVTRFTGSLPFVYLHIALVGFWIGANLGWFPGVPPWDTSFVVLAMLASVEAIFLSTFVLINQNRMSAIAEKRAHLDLQISLLTEHEITTLAALMSEIATRLGVETELHRELDQIKLDIAPEAVLDKIEAERS